MSTERVEEIRADEVKVGDRIKAPEGRAFYELTVAEHKPGREGEVVELGTSWGSVTLNPGDIVERENWIVGDAGAEVEERKAERLADIATLIQVASEPDAGWLLNATTVKWLEAGEDSRRHVQMPPGNGGGGLEEEILGLGFSQDGAPLDEQAEQLIDDLPLGVEVMTTFEVVLGTGRADERLVFECSGGGIELGSNDRAASLEIRLILYRYSWAGSAERALSGEEREIAEAFGRRVVPELGDA